MEKNPVEQARELGLDIPLDETIVIGPLAVAILAEFLQLDIGKSKEDRDEAGNL